MNVLNIHERKLDAALQQVGALLDSLAGPTDSLWPHQSWPHMKFDRPLSVGAVGGHGPIRYVVESYSRGQSVKFRFTGPTGFDGYHGYEVFSAPAQDCVLRHTLKMTTRGLAVLSWPLVFGPMHDALIEDSLAVAQASLGLVPTLKPWSLWVRLLRRLVSRGRVRPQNIPTPKMASHEASGS